MPKAAYSKKVTNSSETLTVAEAAEFLGVSNETLRRWDNRGKLVAQRTLGGQRRYSLVNLEAFKELQSAPRKISPTIPAVPVAEAAHILGVSKQTVRRWEKSGELEAHRTPGGQRRFNFELLARLKSFRFSPARFSPANSPLPKMQTVYHRLDRGLTLTILTIGR